jgi:hypothetical protein
LQEERRRIYVGCYSRKIAQALGAFRVANGRNASSVEELGIELPTPPEGWCWTIDATFSKGELTPCEVHRP